MNKVVQLDNSSSRSYLYESANNPNRISMDKGGQELSQIQPRRFDQMNSLDEQDELKSFGLHVEADTNSSYKEKNLEYEAI